MDSFKTEAGRCLITDEKLQIEASVTSYVQRKYEQNSRFFYLGIGAILFVIWLLYAFPNMYPRSFWEQLGGMALLLGVILLPMAILILGGNMFKLWLAKRKGDFPNNSSNQKVIPMRTIQSVELAKYRSNPVAYVHFSDDGDEVRTRPVFFQPHADDEVKKARMIFRSRGLLHET